MLINGYKNTLSTSAKLGNSAIAVVGVAGCITQLEPAPMTRSRGVGLCGPSMTRPFSFYLPTLRYAALYYDSG